MNKYLAIFIGSASEEQKQALSPAQGEHFMQAWAAWAQKHQGAILDPGAPLATTVRVSGAGITPAQNSWTAFMLVQAGTHAAAAQLFVDHPHVALMRGNAVEVVECPPLPAS